MSPVAIQYPMFTLPIPPENPLMWNEQPPPPPEPPQTPPAILSGGADASGGGGTIDFTCGTDVACSGLLDYGADTNYGTVVPADQGDGTTGNVLRWTVTGFTAASTYHYRFRVTGLNPPNETETVGPDRTVVAE
jgi:hypothetical protein